MNINRAVVVKFLGSALAASVLTMAAQSSAFFVRQHGADCFLSSAAPSVVVSNSVLNYGPAAGLYCPAPDNSTMPIGNATSVNVHVNDGTTADGFLVMPCWTAYNGTAGGCDTYQTTSNAFKGEYMFAFGAPTSFGSAHYYDFKYVRVSMPGVQSSSPSALRGLFYAN